MHLHLLHSLTCRNWRLSVSHVWQFSHHPSCILAGGNDLSGHHGHPNQSGPGPSGHPGQSGNLSQFGHHGQSGHSGQSGLVTPVCVVTLVTICTLHNFQFYLAHLWTDFQSCFRVDVSSGPTWSWCSSWNINSSSNHSGQCKGTGSINSSISYCMTKILLVL